MTELRLIKELREKAEVSPRKRTVCMLSEADGDTQIMLNFLLKNSYIRPHRHNRPEQKSSITSLIGSFKVLKFLDDGLVESTEIIEDSKKIDIAPGVWHTVVCLSDEGLLFEINGGVYNAQDDKENAVWAPEENTVEASEYVQKLITL